MLSICIMVICISCAINAVAFAYDFTSPDPNLINSLRGYSSLVDEYNEKYSDLCDDYNARGILQSGLFINAKQKMISEFNSKVDYLVNQQNIASQNYYYNNGSNYSGLVNTNNSWMLQINSNYQYNLKNNTSLYSNDSSIAFSNGSTYRGATYNGMPNGMGKMILKNKGVLLGSYEGYFINGKFSGQGCFTVYAANGAGYEIINGFWNGLIPVGIVDVVYSDGNKYHGSLLNYKKSGYGKDTYANGDTYEGTFTDGVRNGMGKYTYANGKYIIGNWVNGKFTGQ